MHDLFIEMVYHFKMFKTEKKITQRNIKSYYQGGRDTLIFNWSEMVYILISSV